MTAAGTLRSGTPPEPGAIDNITAEDDSDPSFAFEDDLLKMFAGPAVRDTSSSFSTHLSNDAIPDDVYKNDINPLWLDWLSDSIERLPSDALAAAFPQQLLEDVPFATSDDAEDDINPLWLDWLNDSIERLPSVPLDGNIPQQLPRTNPFATPVKNIPFTALAEASAVAPMPSRATTDVRAKVALTSSMALAAARPPPAPVMMQMLMFVPESRIFVHAPRASVVAPTAAAEVDFEAAVCNADVDVKVDIDGYVPQTLRPVHPAAQAQQRARRQAALPRFREKKGRCHFKRTIRYQSRQVYADVRPRIKGRFARADEVATMRAAGKLPPL